MAHPLGETNSAPSSSTPTLTYDVFVSSHSDDTRATFTAHLLAALEREGIHAYRDNERSRIAVVVFLGNYATSEWCLDELVKILECKSELGQKVLPIFYHVRPSKVGEQSGDFVQGHLNGDGEMVNIWRTALRKAAKLSGRHLK